MVEFAKKEGIQIWLEASVVDDLNVNLVFERLFRSILTMSNQIKNGAPTKSISSSKNRIFKTIVIGPPSRHDFFD
jgi:hypothetical protein